MVQSWKDCVVNATVGSNPTLSAIYTLDATVGSNPATFVPVRHLYA